MTSLSRKEIAQSVLAQLRGVGPQTVADIRADLLLNKRQTEDALHLLVSHGQVEYDYPPSSPLVYKAVRS